MKKIIVVFALLLSLSAIAQDFPGKRPELLLGKEVKVKALSGIASSLGYVGFYTDPKLKNIYEQTSFETKAEAIFGRQFKVENVEKTESAELSKLTLKDDKDEILYFKYNSSSEYYYPFTVVGGIKYPADFYCDYIDEKTDKFSGKSTFTTSNTEGVFFYKVKNGAAAKYYMQVKALGKEQVAGKGAIVLLKNNKRIDKPESVVEVTTNRAGSFIYTSTFELSLKEINVLIDSEITDVRVIKFDSEIKLSGMLKGMLDCLITK
ncbi:hypothetical protein [Flavobacterium cerinum]|uniref:DUF3108 domain-containing protein n=1 Tax=Flavobacterium cerinum TaxID=2502784 RepID=A0A3S3U281_9FLAO|nr:hypothetical protein [Flavobacterium cerinum]RWW99704.1 hypothetical protein EPI11_12185 [Flavobacterium cerinum]